MVAFIGSVLIGLLVLVAAIVAVVFLALCTPIRVSGRVSRRSSDETDDTVLDGVAWHGEIRWLLGVIRLRTWRTGPGEAGHQFNLAGLAIGGSRARKSSEKAKQKQKGGENNKRHERGKRKLPDAGMMRTACGELPRLVRRMRHAFSGQLDGEVTYGFDDPALTGMACGLIATLPRPRGLMLMPHYSNACLNGWIAGKAGAYPIAFVAIGTWALFRPGVRQLWWNRLRARLRFTRTAS